MPSTPNGYPYPNPSDPVAQGAAAIQALATQLDDGPVATDNSFLIAQPTATGGFTFLTVDGGYGGVRRDIVTGELLVTAQTGIRLTPTGASMVLAVGRGVVTTHDGTPMRVIDAILGPANTAASYSVAFVAAFTAAPVLAGDKTNPFDVPLVNVSATGFTVNNGGASGVQGRWHAMGPA